MGEIRRVIFIGLCISIISVLIFNACDSQRTVAIEDSLEFIRSIEPIEEAQNVTINLRDGHSEGAFFLVDLSNIKSNPLIGNGLKEAWCIEWDISSVKGEQRGVKLHSTKGQELWSDVNYFLSTKDAFEAEHPDLGWKESQIILWALVKHKDFNIDAIPSYQNFSNHFYKDGQYLFDVELSKKIITEVKAADPGAENDSFAIILENDGQTVIIEPEVPNGVIISENTEILTSESINNIISSNNDMSEITFNASNNQIGSLEVGDIIVSDVNTVAPNGFLKKIITLSENGNYVTVTTEEAKLTDVIENGSISDRRELKIEQSDIAPKSSNVNILGCSYDESRNKNVCSFTVELDENKLSGEIAFGIDQIFNLDIENSEVKDLELRIDGEFENSLTHSFEAGRSVNLSYRLFEIKKFPTIRFFVGPVPVTIKPELDVGVFVSGYVGRDYEFGYNASLSTDFGTKYSSNTWNNIANVTPAANFRSITSEEDTGFKVGFDLVQEFKFYGVAGPTIGPTLFLEPDININDNPWWQLYWGMDLALGFKAGLETGQEKIDKYIDRFGISYNTKFNIFKNLLAEASGPRAGENNFYLADNGVTIMCPTATIGEKGVVNGIEYEAVDRELLIQRRDEGADLSRVCTSNVRDMRSLFASSSFNDNKYSTFNDDISKWDVSNVTNMRLTFLRAESFNQDISDWNVGNVSEMSGMFASAKSFNQNIGNWDVSKVTRMTIMFDRAFAFNQDLGNWDVSNVIEMRGMFFRATSFNEDIRGWDVSKVTDMNGMFAEASSFNIDIGEWDISKVKIMSQMFRGASSFNQDISNWDTSNVPAFFQYGTLTVGSMGRMFEDAIMFNQDLSNWCVENIGETPPDFDTGATNWVEPRPIWGTCPL